MSSPDETQPLLPTHSHNVDKAIPSKATVFKAAEIMAAFRAGKLPTQNQLNKTLTQLANSNILDPGAVGRTGRFSENGQLVVGDLLAVLNSIIQVGQEKNADDKIQRFIYHTSQAALRADLSDVRLPNAPSTRELDNDAQKAAESMHTLGNLVITSPEFRSVISDITLFARDWFADVATAAGDKAKEAADAARPSDAERTNGVDLDRTVSSAKKRAKKTQKEYESGRYHSAVREWAEDQLPDDTDIHTEAKDALIERLKALVVSVQKEDGYHRAVDELVGLVKKYGRRAVDVVHSGKVEVKRDGDAEEAAGLLKEIVETWAGGKALDDVAGAFDRVKKDVEGDDRLRAYFDDVGKYIDRLLHDEGYVLTQKASRRADRLIDRANNLVESNAAWKDDVRALVDEVRAYQAAFENDKATKELWTHVTQLTEDLGDFGEAGFDLLSAKARGLYRDLYNVVLPRLIRCIKQVPLPRIEYSSAELDVVIDDFVLDSVSFIPDKIEFSNYVDLTLEQGYAAFATNFDSSTRLRVTGFRFSASDIAYYINSKSGWGWEDAGLLEVDLTDGEGLSFDVELETAEDVDRETYFKVKTVTVDLTNLDYSVSRSDHWFFNTILKPFTRGYVQGALRTALEGQIRGVLERADKELYGLHQRARAASVAAPSLSAYFRALFATGSSPFGASARAKQNGVIVTGAHGEFQLAIGADEMLLPGRGGPSEEYERRREMLEEAKKVKGAFGGSVASVKDRIGSVGVHAKRAKRGEEARDGWKSTAFDL